MEQNDLEDIENLRRSIAMLPVGAEASLTRERALWLFEELRVTREERDRLADELVALGFG